MAAYVSGVDRESNCVSFTISSPSDISKLPTTSQDGNEELENIKKIPGGDAICISTGDVYVLDAEDDTWKIL